MYGMVIADSYGHWMEFTAYDNDTSHNNKTIIHNNNGFENVGTIGN